MFFQFFFLFLTLLLIYQRLDTLTHTQMQVDDHRVVVQNVGRAGCEKRRTQFAGLFCCDFAGQSSPKLNSTQSQDANLLSSLQANV